ncbi:MAG: T9SS type A sorting domain-containing protein [bacterium]|nr:T9SS type A sorting domain-containing protein [bacterium]
MMRVFGQSCNRRVGMMLLVFALMSPCIAATVSAGIVVLPSGGGLATAGGNSVRAVVGETLSGPTQNGDGCLGAGFLFGRMGDLTPVMLLDFTANQSESGVSLEWYCVDFDRADFRLEASLDDQQWLVPWRVLGPGAFGAEDEGTDLAAGGEISYLLLVREASGAEWMPLGRTELLLPAAVIPTALNAAYPNPFNPVTGINFSLRKTGLVRLRVFDAAGRLVRTLVDEDLPAGHHSLNWDGCNDADAHQASGVYLLRMETAGFSDSQRLVLLK